jgi:CHASE2 domain-containing sensor protein
MRKLFSAASPLLVSAIILAGLYVGSYAALVTSQASPTDPLMAPRVARYRVGGAYAQVLFVPLELVDRKLRHEYWTTPDCLRDWER